MKKAIIFDLDGTLWDASAEVSESWNRTLERRGIPVRTTAEDMRTYMGKTMAEIAALLLPDWETAAREDMMAELCRREVEDMRPTGAKPYPGLEDTLSALRERYALMIVSNCQEGYIRCFLEPHGMGRYFDDYEEWGRTHRPKGENIRLVMERGGVEEAIYVGDTAGDESAARWAGIPFIHAAYGFGAAAAPDAAIEDIRDLPTAAAAIFAQKEEFVRKL